MAECKSNITVVLLPGFDGIGHLFTPILRELPSEIRTQVISYRTDMPMDYRELRLDIQHALPESPFILVAESFSGPLALQIAGKQLNNLRGVILAASFVQNPRPVLTFFFQALLKPWLFRLPATKWAIRHFMAGPIADEKIVNAVMSALNTVTPETLYARLRAIMSADATVLLTESRVPLFCIFPNQDKLIGNAGKNHILQIRPDIKFEEIDGPHMILQVSPASCAEAIVSFIEEVCN